MTVVRPFRALRYDAERVELSQVIVPPYDVIASDERARFFARDPHNAIRFELTRDVAEEATTDYTEIAETLAAWQADRVLVRDRVPGYYVMRQRFTAPDGRLLERVGFFGELFLEDYDRAVVRPHERTMSGPKEDRLRLLRAARANLSSVFLLYEDREQRMAAVLARALEGPPLGRASDDGGVEYTLAAIRDEGDLETIRAFFSHRPVVIADGHHRYETALAYRDEVGAAPGDPAASTLAYFANAYAPGTLLLPIHRVVVGRRLDRAALDARLADWKRESLRIESAGEIPARLESHLAAHAGKPAFVADDGSGELLVFWRDTQLPDLMVRILESEVLGAVFGLGADDITAGAVHFPKSAARAAQEVRAEPGGVALYLNPLTADDVFAATAAGERMPQKSTFFHPKVPTGFVFRLHDDAADAGTGGS